MRIDKYLWCVRQYKTRNMVTEAAKKNQITVNGQVAKPSREVFPGDTVTFRKEQVTRTIKVLDVPANRVGAKLVDMYRKDETPIEVLQQLELMRLARNEQRWEGEGRPTKKDRRDIDDYLDPEDSDHE
ncbi:MAG: RNA-binding S4 domain-containing protein [Chitinophagaceae bacterium]|nr:MAG: RNA-binding S4 domain-containing protein [Chitinophagaceae bacterium]